MTTTSLKRGVRGTLYKPEPAFSKPDPDCQIQNVPSARVYVFGNADVAEEEVLNDEDQYELRPRGKHRQNQQKKDSQAENEPVSIEREILKGETLAKIAVKYCCEVADLKRLNNLLTEQDFFALATIKVPVQRHGLVRERLEEEIRQMQSQSAASASTNGSAVRIGANSNSTHSVFQLNGNELSDHEEWSGINGVSDDENCETQKLLVQNVSIRNALTGQGRDAQDFLKRMDTDIKQILTSSNSAKRNLDEVRSTLTCRRIYPLKRRDSILGADCGIKFSSIVAVLVIVALVTPLIYFLYYEYIKPPDIHALHHPVTEANDGS